MCVVEFNVSTLPCRHRWYHLLRPCSPSTNLNNCPNKLRIEGWETKCDFCPHCASWNLNEADFRLVGNDRSLPVGGLLRSPSADDGVSITPTTPIFTPDDRHPLADASSKSDIPALGLSVVEETDEKNRAILRPLDAYLGNYSERNYSISYDRFSSSTRRSRYNIGYCDDVPFDSIVHSKQDEIVDNHGRTLARDQVIWLVRKGQILERGNIFEFKVTRSVKVPAIAVFLSSERYKFTQSLVYCLNTVPPTRFDNTIVKLCSVEFELGSRRLASEKIYKDPQSGAKFRDVGLTLRIQLEKDHLGIYVSHRNEQVTSMKSQYPDEYRSGMAIDAKDIGTELHEVAPPRASFTSMRTYRTARTFQSTASFESAVSDMRSLVYGSRMPVRHPRDPRYHVDDSLDRLEVRPPNASHWHPSNHLSKNQRSGDDRTSQYRVQIVGADDFELCQEPWLLSALLSWLQRICGGLKSFQRQDLVTALESLLSHKTPGIPFEYVKKLSEQIVHSLESGKEPAVVWSRGHGQWTLEKCSGVLPELTGGGCYARRLHIVDSKTFLACYSVLCCSAQSVSPWLRCLRSHGLTLELNKEWNWSGRGQHAEFKVEEAREIPLDHERNLGHGAYGCVDSVRCGRIRLARKTIRCNRRMKREAAVAEVAHLQRLSHPHIVQVIGTYIFANKQDLHVLLYPVAEYDLEDYMDTLLDNDTADKEQRLSSLKSFFPCLTRTLAFIHGHCIKHMDIKPRNILVRDMRTGSIPCPTAFKVYLADFGISRAYKSAEDAETSSPTSFSRLSSAPEVVVQETRGLSADVFSLGCVFAEMAATILELRDQLADIRGDSFARNLEKVSAFLQSLLRNQDIDHNVALWLKQILGMLEPNPRDRPSAQQLLKTVGWREMECCSTGPDILEEAV